MRTLPTALVAFLFSAAACGGGGSDPNTRTVGATSFEAQPPGGPSRGLAGATAAGLPMPASAGSATSDAAASDAAAARAIEEADVYQRVGAVLYVLNTYRGLQAVDLTDPARPRFLWRVPVSGRPVDLYVRGGAALVAVSDAFSYAAAADGAVQPRRGSRLVSVDLVGANGPSITADLSVEGVVEQTRIVGDVLYVVSRRPAWYDWVPGSGGTTTTGGGTVGSGTVTSGSGTAIVPIAPGAVGPGTDTVFVASFDVRVPAQPLEIARVELSATGWATHASVTDQRITLSFAGYGGYADGGYGPLTEFRMVDISDPGGQMTLGGARPSMPGMVQDRWSMDDAGGLFRAVASLGWNAGAALAIWSSPDRDTATPRPPLVIPVQETLTAARFDGSRVYVVTAKRTDPLWAVDASDPDAPVVTGSLHMAGQLDYLEPRGDRLVALGHTDEASGPFQLAVSLLDVTSLSSPQLLARVPIGEGRGWVAAAADDLRKAFLVFDPKPAGIGLVLVPIQGWDATGWRQLGGTQLVDLARDTLTLRGFVDHPGVVTRAFPLDPDGATLAALSDSALQTIAASDRDRPSELARLDLARSVSTLTVVAGKAVELCGDWYRGTMELAVTDALDPDAPVPLARVDLAAPQARMLRDGTVLWILAHDGAGASWLQAVDVANPAQPVARGRLDLAPGETFGYARWWGYGDEAVLVGHALAVHHGGWPCVEVCLAGGAVPASTASAAIATTPGPGEIRVYDLADPDHPRLASTVAPPGAAWAWGLSASGTYLWLTHFEWSASPDAGRYYLDRVDLADPANPRLLPRVNVPGVFLAAAPDASRIYTVETQWGDAGATAWLHRLELDAATARLDASVRVDGYPSGVASAGGFAWVVAQATAPRLVAVDLGAMAATSAQDVSGSWAWLRTAAGGKLFLDAGWQEQALLLYGLDDPAHPAFEQSFRTPGWVSDVVVADGRAYLPSGPYGVPVIDLR